MFIVYLQMFINKSKTANIKNRSDIIVFFLFSTNPIKTKTNDQLIDWSTSGLSKLKLPILEFSPSWIQLKNAWQKMKAVHTSVRL